MVSSNRSKSPSLTDVTGRLYMQCFLPESYPGPMFRLVGVRTLVHYEQDRTPVIFSHLMRELEVRYAKFKGTYPKTHAQPFI